ncbi:hypothetical protein [Paenibacillus fonticola]|uniref:hypothetical protein n=1 Tax=Paenibacillus fonticola TaxID=379896 RepID=UPI00037F02B2|nr:hypothetical protein [Paenibacillus fonticola]
MKWDTKAAMAAGFLAGTTFGSGIGFLLHWQSYDLVTIVSVSGVAGAIGGIGAVRWYRRNFSSGN